MDLVNLLITLVSGAVGGNVAGAAVPDKSLGGLGNTIAGLFGGAAGHWLLQAAGLIGTAAKAAEGAGIDVGALLANIGGSGVGGAILTLIIGLIKNAASKSGK